MILWDKGYCGLGVAEVVALGGVVVLDPAVALAPSEAVVAGAVIVAPVVTDPLGGVAAVVPLAVVPAPLV